MGVSESPSKLTALPFRVKDTAIKPPFENNYVCLSDSQIMTDMTDFH
jgi:hypothetical protein